MEIYAFLGWIAFGCVILVNTVVAFAWKPFLAAYMGKKGERLATSEDIQKVLVEVRAVTRETERIKAEISGDEWHRQWVMNQKREIYRELLGVVNEMQNCYAVLISLHPFTGSVEAKSVDDAFNDLRQRVVEFRKAQALALVFLAEPANQALEKYMKSPDSGTRVPAERFDTAIGNLETLRDELVAAAKSELRLEGSI